MHAVDQIKNLSPRCRLGQGASTVGVQDLLIVEDTTWTSQEENSSGHVGVLARTTSWIRHLGFDDALVIVIRRAGSHLHRMSMDFE
jgi:hypothetical protein